MSARWIYSFGNGHADGSGGDRQMLGGKGAGLAEMTRLGVPVPPGFTISTEVSVIYDRESRTLPAELLEQMNQALQQLEDQMGRRFGDPENPLLVSVRSGARVSMPGMMDTILNVGLSSGTIEGLVAHTGNARFAWDSYRRLIQMFGDVVMGVHSYYFEEELHEARERAGVRTDDALSDADLRELVDRYRALILQRAGRPFPEDPRTQLQEAVIAVFESWYNKRAFDYRNMNDIPHTWGTAVNVQSMVFGNMGDDSATGVTFTRNPSTGEPVLYGEFLANAQGEDVVAGIRTPQPILQVREGDTSMQSLMPEAFEELRRIQAQLERHYRDMQDIEFTVERGRVWILQTRSGKRTAAAEVRIAVDLANEGVITREDAVLRVSPERLEALLHPAIDRSVALDIIARGLPASPGAATGRIAFTADEAESLAEQGIACVLVRNETSPEDIRGMKAAVAIMTARGGMTSHAAVVARQMGKCCIVGCHALRINLETRTIAVGERHFDETAVLSLDGTTGDIIAGAVPLRPAQLTASFHELMSWADAVRTIGVRTNADNGSDSAQARTFGAEGIGLTRTEHMFFEDGRINTMREMILAHGRGAREKALEKLRPFQKRDFVDILWAMSGCPVTIRLLDPPLHEFLPQRESDIDDLAERMGLSAEDVHRTVERLRESNPMLGHRGCRLAITYPEIYDMQARAIFDAALQVRAEGGNPRPEIMIPLVATARELKQIRERIEGIIRTEYAAEAEWLQSFPIGTMIELPRACATAGEIAAVADFFSFGTNDLTQTVFGFSRDDVSTFLPSYLQAGILDADPFVTLDREGVGALIRMAVEAARATRPDIKIGLCGEHGGDPRSISFVQQGLVHYVSCSPFRVPVARLAAAQASLRNAAAAANT